MKNQRKILPTAASFLVTEDCNLACTYCFELDGRNNEYMTEDVARRSLEYLAFNAIETGENHFSAMIFGGEPLMNPEIVEVIFSYGVELARKYNLHFSTSIVTNATILTDKIEAMLRKYKHIANLHVQLSVDGIKKVHDRYRVTRGGKGSFDIIEKNIPRWKAIFEDNLDRLNIHGCSNKETLPYLYENYIFFREIWDIPYIWFMPIHSEEWTDKDVDIYEEQLGKIVDYILDNVRRTGNYNEVVNYAPIDRCLRPDFFPIAPCAAGKNFITITATGDFYPCHQVYFNDKEKATKIGNLNEGLDEDARRLFLAIDNSDFSCATLDPECDAYHCYRCMGDNLIENGSILSTVDCLGPRCKMSKIERKLQLRVKGELIKMGLLQDNKLNQEIYTPGNNPNNPDCLCDSRGDNIYTSETESTQSCKGCSDNYEQEATETIAMALQLILEKIDLIEKTQDFMLKKFFKD